MEEVKPAMQLTNAELVQLCAVDTQLYCKVFHPNTFRQDAPPFDREIWKRLENPNARYFELMSFRGSAKTTRFRGFAAKRIAYGMSRTILYIGASERDAIRSVQWIRNQVDRNHHWAGTFGLKPGVKWEETQIEILHSKLAHPIWVLGAGISGSLRGINFDDYRPDLIIVDDPLTDEVAASEEQREKIGDLILGAVKNSLAPEIDEPNAKLVMGVTPQHAKDFSMQALEDPQWHSVVIPCWTEDTLHLPVSQQISVWEERFPTTVLRADKLAAIRRNKLSIFSREMECRLRSKESAKFRASWLNFYDEKPGQMFNVLSIDPVPPPSQRQLAKGLVGKDMECLTVWGRGNGGYWLHDYVLNKGHTPSWTIAKMFELARKYRVARIVVETVAYQQVLKWLIEQEMKRRQIFYPIVEYRDGQSKFSRIENAFGGLGPEGLLNVSAQHSQFIEDFEAYPDNEYFDLLDASAIALSELSNPYLESLDGKTANAYVVEEFPFEGACP